MATGTSADRVRAAAGRGAAVAGAARPADVRHRLPCGRWHGLDRVTASTELPLIVGCRFSHFDSLMVETSPAHLWRGFFCAPRRNADPETNARAPGLSGGLAGRSVPGAWPLTALGEPTGKPTSWKPTVAAPLMRRACWVTFAEWQPLRRQAPSGRKAYPSPLVEWPVLTQRSR